MIVTFAPGARQEFAEAVRWYAVEAGGVRAADFRNAVQRTIALLTRHPLIGTPSASNTRRMVVHRYPYAVVYRLDADTLRILALAHQGRRPGYWGGRR